MKDEKNRSLTSALPKENAHLELNDPRLFRDLLGQHDQHIKILQQALDVRIRVRGSSLELEGDPLQVELASQIIRQLYGLLEKGYPVYPSDVDYAIRILSGDSRAKLQDIFSIRSISQRTSARSLRKASRKRLTSMRFAVMTSCSVLDRQVLAKLI